MTASAIKWEAAASAAKTTDVLGTELNTLGSTNRSAAGAAYDNGTGLNRDAWLEIVLASFTSGAGSPYITLHMVKALDGSNYEDGSDTVAPSALCWVADVPVRSSLTGAQRITTPRFDLPPCPVKFLLTNSTGAALASSGNHVHLYTDNPESQ